MGGSGIFAGVGINVGGGTTNGQMTSGSSMTGYFEMNMGMGPGIGTSATINEDGTLGGGSGYGHIFPGAALGAMACVGVSQTTNLVSPAFGDTPSKVDPIVQTKNALI